MRLFEILSPSFSIKDTKRFLKNFAYYLRGYPQLEQNFIDFCDAKRNGERFGIKDVPFSNTGPLSGYMHVHLVHGKVILIYTLKNNVLKLYDIGEHTMSEGKNAISMKQYLKSLDDSDFATMPSLPDPELSGENKKELADLLQYFAASDPEFLRNASVADLLDYMRETVDSNDQVILNYFGGENGLKSVVNKILKQYGIN